MSTIKVDAIVDASGGNNATVNGIVPQPAIGFTPVEQGGGTTMGTNKVYVGWDTSGYGLRAQVDITALGRLILNGSTGSTSLQSATMTAPGNSPLFACRAWGVCDANGNFVAGGNVASISGLNPTTATFITPMIDANYCVVVSGFGQESNTRYPHIRGKAAGSVAFANGGGVAGGMWFAVFQ